MSESKFKTRQERHDQRKLKSPEKEIFEIYTPKLCVCGKKAQYERIFLGSKKEPNLHLCRSCYNKYFLTRNKKES